MPLLLKHPDSSLLRNLKHTKAADKNEWLLYDFLKLNNMRADYFNTGNTSFDSL